MSKPTQPSLITIAQEGLKLCGYPSGGDATLQAVAQSFIEESKMDIWNVQNQYRVKIKPLLVTAWGVTTENVSRYANPSDCDVVHSVNLCEGTSGTASAVTASKVTGPSSGAGKMILLTSGTGIGNCSQISSISGGGANLTPNFSGSSFAGTENYLIIDEIHELTQKTPQTLDEIDAPFDKDIPTHWYPQGQGMADGDETGEFELYPVPDAVYGLKIRYYMNIMLLDLSTDANLIGSIYRQLKPIFIQKVIYRMHQRDRNWDYARTMEKQYWAFIETFIKNYIDDYIIPQPRDLRLYTSNTTTFNIVDGTI